MQCKNCGKENPPEASYCSNCGAAFPTKVTTFPEIGVFSSYEHGWRQLWKYFLELFLIGLIGFIIGLPSGMGSWVLGFAGFFGWIYSIFVVWPVEYGVSYAYLKAARGDKLEIKNMFEVFNNYWNAVLAALLVTIIIVIGLFLLIIPGIIFACKLAFTPYLVVDRKMEVMEAIKGSWNMTNGHTWKVFLIGLLAIPIVIAGIICFGVGVIISIMWVSMALASLYYSVSSRVQPSG